MSMTKLSIFFLFSLAVGRARSCESQCYSTLEEAQDCLRMCINLDPVEAWGGAHDFETNGASRLWQCLDDKKTKVFSSDKLVDLTKCCSMTETCTETMMAARGCASKGCIPGCIKTTSHNYLKCIREKSQQNVCKYAGFACVGRLLGNETPGEPSFDFGSMLMVGANKVTTTDCSPLEGFVDGICSVSQMCCSQCNDRMGIMASCLVNDFVMPLSVTAGTVNCTVNIAGANSPCSLGQPSVAVARSIDEGSRVGEENITSTAFDGINATDCEEGLTMNFIVHNETYAVDQFLACIGTKMVEIYAEEEANAGTQQEGEGASSANAAFGCSIFSLVVTMASMVLTALAL